MWGRSGIDYLRRPQEIAQIQGSNVPAVVHIPGHVKTGENQTLLTKRALNAHPTHWVLMRLAHPGVPTACAKKSVLDPRFSSVQTRVVC